MPDFQALKPICRKACEGLLNVYWADLARWLIEQGDPEWCNPVCVRWWASWIDRHGYPEN